MPTTHVEISLDRLPQVDTAVRERLFTAERRHEMLSLGWPEARAEAMVAMQYHGFTSQLAQIGAHTALDESTWALDGQGVAHLITSTRDDQVRVVWVAVDGEHRGRGIARHLLTPVLTTAHAAGLPVTLHVDPANTAARALYARLGFTEAPGGESAADLFLSTHGSLT